MPLVVNWFCCMPRKRKQNYQPCPWCARRGLETIVRKARVTALERHMVKCKAAYLLEQAQTPVGAKVPSREVLWQMILSQGQEVATLKARLSRLESKRNVTRSKKLISPRECWNRREQTLLAIYKEFGPRKFNFWFDPEIIHVENCITAVMIPVLEQRGEKLCLKNLDTTDIYCFAKQIWGKSNTEVDLAWYRKVCETHCGQKFENNSFQEADESLRRTYERFQATPVRHNGGQSPQGLVRLARLWRDMGGCYRGFEDELWGEGIDILKWETPRLDESPEAPEPQEHESQSS